MGVRFLHLADLHLGSQHGYLGERALSRQQEVLDAFRNAVAFALDPAQRIDAVLIAGNLFDRHRPDPSTWGFVRGLLGRLVAQKLPVVLIPGARDGYGYKDSVYRTERLPGVNVLTNPRPDQPLEREIAGQTVFFYGIAAQPALSDDRFPGFERIDQDGIHIGLLNAALTDHEEFDVRPRLQSVDVATLSRSRLDYVALGGYHGHSVLSAQGTNAVYAGTLEGRRLAPGDFGKKSLVVAEVSADTTEITLHPLSRRVLVHTELDLAAEALNDPEALKAALLALASEDCIARVELTGTLEFLCDLESLADEVRSRFHHLELVDRTDLLGSGLLRRIESENTIRGIYVRRMLQRIGDLTARASTAARDAVVHRELLVSRLALKVGLEQFLEEEPAVRPEEPRREIPAVALPVEVAASVQNGKGKGDSESAPAHRKRNLLRAERVAAHRSDLGGESS